MGHKQKAAPVDVQLSDAVIEAKAVISVLRGLQKDLKALVREANETLDKTAHDLVEDAVNKAVKEMRTVLVKAQDDDLRTMALSLNSAWLALGRAMFGDVQDVKKVAAVGLLVKSCVEQFGGPNKVIDAITPEVEAVFARMLTGVPVVSVDRNGTLSPLIKGENR